MQFSIDVSGGVLGVSPPQCAGSNPPPVGAPTEGKDCSNASFGSGTLRQTLTTSSRVAIAGATRRRRASVVGGSATLTAEAAAGSRSSVAPIYLTFLKEAQRQIEKLGDQTALTLHMRFVVLAAITDLAKVHTLKPPPPPTPPPTADAPEPLVPLAPREASQAPSPRDHRSPDDGMRAAAPSASANQASSSNHHHDLSDTNINNNSGVRGAGEVAVTLSAVPHRSPERETALDGGVTLSRAADPGGVGRGLAPLLPARGLSAASAAAQEAFLHSVISIRHNVSTPESRRSSMTGGHAATTQPDSAAVSLSLPDGAGGPLMAEASNSATPMPTSGIWRHRPQLSIVVDSVLENEAEAEKPVALNSPRPLSHHTNELPPASPRPSSTGSSSTTSTVLPGAVPQQEESGGGLDAGDIVVAVSAVAEAALNEKEAQAVSSSIDVQAEAAAMDDEPHLVQRSPMDLTAMTTLPTVRAPLEQHLLASSSPQHEEGVPPPEHHPELLLVVEPPPDQRTRQGKSRGGSALKSEAHVLAGAEETHAGAFELTRTSRSVPQSLLSVNRLHAEEISLSSSSVLNHTLREEGCPVLHALVGGGALHRDPKTNAGKAPLPPSHVSSTGLSQTSPALSATEVQRKALQLNLTERSPTTAAAAADASSQIVSPDAATGRRPSPLAVPETATPRHALDVLASAPLSSALPTSQHPHSVDNHSFPRGDGPSLELSAPSSPSATEVLSSSHIPSPSPHHHHRRRHSGSDAAAVVVLEKLLSHLWSAILSAFFWHQRKLMDLAMLALQQLYKDTTVESRCGTVTLMAGSLASLGPAVLAAAVRGGVASRSDSQPPLDVVVERGGVVVEPDGRVSCTVHYGMYLALSSFLTMTVQSHNLLNTLKLLEDMLQQPLSAASCVSQALTRVVRSCYSISVESAFEPARKSAGTVLMLCMERASLNFLETATATPLPHTFRTRTELDNYVDDVENDCLFKWIEILAAEDDEAGEAESRVAGDGMKSQIPSLLLVSTGTAEKSACGGTGTCGASPPPNNNDNRNNPSPLPPTPSIPLHAPSKQQGNHTEFSGSPGQTTGGGDARPKEIGLNQSVRGEAPESGVASRRSSLREGPPHHPNTRSSPQLPDGGCGPNSFGSGAHAPKPLQSVQEVFSVRSPKQTASSETSSPRKQKDKQQQQQEQTSGTTGSERGVTQHSSRAGLVGCASSPTTLLQQLSPNSHNANQSPIFRFPTSRPPREAPRSYNPQHAIRTSLDDTLIRQVDSVLDQDGGLPAPLKEYVFCVRQCCRSAAGSRAAASGTRKASADAEEKDVRERVLGLRLLNMMLDRLPCSNCEYEHPCATWLSVVLMACRYDLIESIARNVAKDEPFHLFKSSLQVLGSLLRKCHYPLARELHSLLAIYLLPLTASPYSNFRHKHAVLSLINELFGLPHVVVSYYINYDCNPSFDPSGEYRGMLDLLVTFVTEMTFTDQVKQDESALASRSCASHTVAGCPITGKPLGSSAPPPPPPPDSRETPHSLLTVEQQKILRNECLIVIETLANSMFRWVTEDPKEVAKKIVSEERGPLAELAESEWVLMNLDLPSEAEDLSLGAVGDHVSDNEHVDLFKNHRYAHHLTYESYLLRSEGGRAGFGVLTDLQSQQSVSSITSLLDTESSGSSSRVTVSSPQAGCLIRYHWKHVHHLRHNKAIAVEASRMISAGKWRKAKDFLEDRGYIPLLQPSTEEKNGGFVAPGRSSYAHFTRFLFDYPHIDRQAIQSIFEKVNKKDSAPKYIAREYFHLFDYRDKAIDIAFRDTTCRFMSWDRPMFEAQIWETLQTIFGEEYAAQNPRSCNAQDAETLAGALLFLHSTLHNANVKGAGMEEELFVHSTLECLEFPMDAKEVRAMYRRVSKAQWALDPYGRTPEEVEKASVCEEFSSRVWKQREARFAREAERHQRMKQQEEARRRRRDAKGAGQGDLQTDGVQTEEEINMKSPMYREENKSFASTHLLKTGTSSKPGISASLSTAEGTGRSPQQANHHNSLLPTDLATSTSAGGDSFTEDIAHSVIEEEDLNLTATAGAERAVRALAQRVADGADGKRGGGDVQGSWKSGGTTEVLTNGAAAGSVAGSHNLNPAAAVGDIAYVEPTFPSYCQGMLGVPSSAKEQAKLKKDGRYFSVVALEYLTKLEASHQLYFMSRQEYCPQPYILPHYAEHIRPMLLTLAPSMISCMYLGLRLAEEAPVYHAVLQSYQKLYDTAALFMLKRDQLDAAVEATLQRYLMDSTAYDLPPPSRAGFMLHSLIM